MRYSPLYLLSVLLLVANSLWSQSTDSIPTENEASPTPAFKLKPRLGLGVGSLVFYGEIGRDNLGYHPGSADMAYTLEVSNELNSFLSLSLYTVFGTIHLNEQTNPRQLNLQSQVRSGGFSIAYNFDHFLPSKRDADPFLAIGFESIEFLSKTDLFDASGLRYHYWSDGNPYDRPEDHPDASEAVLLQRDYVYESDIRELDLDGFGRYNERSFGIPLSAGVKFHATDRFRVTLAARYTFMLSDMLDGINADSQGLRAGDAKNDRLLFTYAALGYDLNPVNASAKKTSNDFYPIDEKDMLAATEDTDGDGVPDIKDKCQGTPKDVQVDRHGCPVDSDKDGFPDYLDDEPLSPHTYVDGNGVAMDDDAIYERYLMWSDSIPWKGETQFAEDRAQVKSDLSKTEKVYRIRIARNADGLSQEDINSLLAQSDVIQAQEGEEEVFLVGDYSELPEAVRRKVELQRSGIPSAVVQTNDDGQSYDTVSVDPSLEASIEAEYQTISDFDATVHYRVQVGAFRYPLSGDLFSTAGDILAVKGSDGLTRYVTRSFDELSIAINLKTDLLAKGFKGAFITAYRGGERITLAEAGLNVTNSAKDLTSDQEVSPVNPDEIDFRAVLGAYEGDIPTEELDILLSLKGVKPRRQADGKTLFLGPTFTDRASAEEYLETVRGQGLTQAYISGQFNNKLIPIDEAIELKK